MKFEEIKNKIKNLGNLATLAEVKKAGLRVLKNTKTDDYWLIESEYLKPIIKSPQECESIYVNPKDLNTSIIICQKSLEDLKRSKIINYIEFGGKQKTKGRQKQAVGIQLSEVKSVQGRENWYSIKLKNSPDFFCNRFFNERIFFSYSTNIVEDQTFYGGIFKKEEFHLAQIALLNSTVQSLFIELYGRVGLGEGVLQYAVYEMENLLIMNAESIEIKYIKLLEESLDQIKSRKILSIFEECGIDPKKPIREQEPNPLPDRKKLDDIIFNMLSLTNEERKEVYWGVCELVQNRLKKAESV